MTFSKSREQFFTVYGRKAVEGVSKAEIMKKDGSDVKKRYRLAILTAMNVTPEEWETYDYHTISLNEREQEDEEESEE